MALVQFAGVTRSFEGRAALSELTLDVREGEVLGLIGPNGAGKTTALRILCGLLEPSSGHASIGGHDTHREPLLARKLLSFVPEGAPLYANLSPRQHLALVGRLHGLDEERIAGEGNRLIQALDLADRIDDPIGAFSRGMRQKAPTTAVFKEVLRTWASRGGSVLYTSHLLDVAERLCDRIAVLDHGKLVGVGTMDELRALAGRDGTLEQVFGSLTRSEDPRIQAERLLG